MMMMMMMLELLLMCVRVFVWFLFLCDTVSVFAWACLFVCLFVCSFVHYIDWLFLRFFVSSVSFVYIVYIVCLLDCCFASLLGRFTCFPTTGTGSREYFGDADSYNRYETSFIRDSKLGRKPISEWGFTGNTWYFEINPDIFRISRIPKMTLKHFFRGLLIAAVQLLCAALQGNMQDLMLVTIY